MLVGRYCPAQQTLITRSQVVAFNYSTSPATEATIQVSTGEVQVVLTSRDADIIFPPLSTPARDGTRNREHRSTVDYRTKAVKSVINKLGTNINLRRVCSSEGIQNGIQNGLLVFQ
jgi:hypothetical protein